ncbi:MAG: 23S rRNA (guanosine(2251)-2'-O)-methyltransferase RlmB [Kiritimatiellae bacterium]|nr:23S rRNA (guanosine(2251)-2'-O)-methyltransferase RlmB [Kiritimatiellia bacterium]
MGSGVKTGVHPKAERERGEWLYGRRPVLEALRAGRRHHYELWLAEAGPRRGAPDAELAEARDRALNAGAAFRTVPRTELDTLLPDAHHQGVALRSGSFPYHGFDQILHAVRQDARALVLLLDHLEDPQNLGALLRTADAAGVTGVVLPNDRAAEVTAAAVRASAGASEHLRVARVVNLPRAIEELKTCECWITGLDMDAEARLYTEVDFKGRCGIVVGNEGSGLGRLVREHCDFVARLPMRGHVASLNASVAGALVLYEVLRQRNAAEMNVRR